MPSVFDSIKLTPDQQKDCDIIKQAFDALWAGIEITVSPKDGRYLAITKTKLEEACMFAIKAISRGQAAK